MNKHLLLTRLLRISCFIFLFSRGFLYTFHDSPWRSLLWLEDLMRPLVEFLGSSWKVYANTSDPYILQFENCLGMAMMGTAFCFLFIQPDRTISPEKDSGIKPAGRQRSQQWQRGLIAGAGIFTMMHMLLVFLGHNREFNMIPEYLLQGLTPWIFLALLKYMPENKEDYWKDTSPTFNLFLRIAVAACFLGHGLYASGIPYQPATFNRMLSKALSIDFETAAILVKGIGIIDIVLAILVFIKPLEKVTLGHMAFWGLVTAGSRVVCYVIIPWKLSNINPWLLETTVRIPHGALPLAMLMLLQVRQSEGESSLWPNLQQVLHGKRKLIGSCCAGLLALIVFQQVLANKYDFKAAYALDKQQIQSKSIAVGAGDEFPHQAEDAHRKHSHTNTIDETASLELNRELFHSNAKGELYSDEIFANKSFPVRLQFDVNSDPANDFQPELDSLQPFYKSRKRILSTIRAEIIASYQEQSKKNLEEQAVFKFVKKVLIIKDDDKMIQAKISAPWLEDKWLLLDIDQHGDVIDPAMFEMQGFF